MKDKYFIFVGIANIAIFLVVVLWVAAFGFMKWNGSYDDGLLIVLDAISVQLTIFEILLVLAGLVLAFVGIWGYQKLEDFVKAEIEDNASEIIAKEVAKQLNAIGHKQPTLPTKINPENRKVSAEPINKKDYKDENEVKR